MIKVECFGSASQIDVPLGAKRSCEGALHFVPGGVYHLTEDEWNHVRKARGTENSIRALPVPVIRVPPDPVEAVAIAVEEPRVPKKK